VHPASNPQDDEALMSNSKGTILVVDDDRLVLATLAHGLSQAGYDVIDADNGDDAILLAREHRPQLALLDIRMQGMSGFDVAAYLRTYCHVPFMFLSAFADAQTAAQVKALGAVAYLVKPLDIGQILPVVEAAFANLLPHLADAAMAMPELAADQAMPEPEVLMAVGVLMHRYSLQRAAAFEHLHRLAAAEQLGLVEQARRVLDAVELLALPAAVT
jgi:two-component system, response regulator PdtaR